MLYFWMSILTSVEWEVSGAVPGSAAAGFLFTKVVFVIQCWFYSSILPLTNDITKSSKIFIGLLTAHAGSPEQCSYNCTRHQLWWLTDSKKSFAWKHVVWYSGKIHCAEKNSFLVVSLVDFWACCQKLLKIHLSKYYKTFWRRRLPKDFSFFRRLVAVNIV